MCVHVHVCVHMHMRVHVHVHVCVCGGGGGRNLISGIAVLIVTVSHRTFSGQFKHLSGQIFPLSNQINTSSYVCMYIGNAFESMSKHFTMSTGIVYLHALYRRR